MEIHCYWCSSGASSSKSSRDWSSREADIREELRALAHCEGCLYKCKAEEKETGAHGPQGRCTWTTEQVYVDHTAGKDHRAGAQGQQGRCTWTTGQVHTDHRAGAHGPQSRCMRSIEQADMDHRAGEIPRSRDKGRRGHAGAAPACSTVTIPCLIE